MKSEETVLQLPQHLEAIKTILESAEIDYEEISTEDKYILIETEAVVFSFTSDGELLGVVGV